MPLFLSLHKVQYNIKVTKSALIKIMSQKLIRKHVRKLIRMYSIFGLKAGTKNLKEHWISWDSYGYLGTV